VFIEGAIDSPGSLVALKAISTGTGEILMDAGTVDAVKALAEDVNFASTKGELELGDSRTV
jgi:hypothetical protein